LIAVVTGPSAAGKSTWCRVHHPGDTIEEYAPTGAEPGPDDPIAGAAYWCAASSARWAAAVDREAVSGLAVCDDDPLKLHYSWSLWQIGEAGRAQWAAEVAAHRAAVAGRRLGFADLYLVSVPPLTELRQRRDADATRRRSNFALHLRLAEPLRRWYTALDELRPGRMLWELPPGGLPAVLPEAGHRYDVALFDALIERLR
jgi:hypothetical protein